MIPILVCAMLSLLMTAAVRWIAHRESLFDVPNERSSHVVPTPRLGGVAVFCALLGTGITLTLTGRLGRPLLLTGPLLGSLLLFSVGVLDDLRPVPWVLRWALQAIAVTLVLVGVSGIPPSNIALAWLGFLPVQLLALIGGVWIINVFNFMDGIDGIAASETIFIGAAAGVLWAISHERWMADLLWLVAAAAAGFLILNWPPAKIFLGDCGSGLLGFLIAVNIIFAASVAHRLFWPMLILPCVFIADATVTLIARIVRKQKWYEAHRSHAYQHAALRWGHLRTTLGVIALNILWTLPLAWFAFWFPQGGPIILIAAFTPLAALALRLGGGRNK